MRDPIFRKALNRFEKATRADEVSGLRPPEEWNAISDEYNFSRIALIRMVEGTPDGS